MGNSANVMSGEQSAVSRKPIVPIGVFDSGVGAYLVAEGIRKKIPGARIIVKTDPEYFPYGDKSSDIIQRRLVHFAKEFQKEGCQIVVIACNSATTNGIRELRLQFPDMQFVGIEPPVKPIVSLTKTGNVVVIGTEATMKSDQFKRLIQKYGGGVQVSAIACPGLAELIEGVIRRSHSGANEVSDGISRDPISASRRIQDDMKQKLELKIRDFLDRPIADGVDVVGIACTHYPYVLPFMKKLYPTVTFYDPTDAVVRRVQLSV